MSLTEYSPTFMKCPVCWIRLRRARERLIYSGRSRLEGEMCRFKGRIAGNSHSIARICNDEAVHFSPKMHVFRNRLSSSLSSLEL